MQFKLFVLCAIVAATQAGYLQPALRYAGPAIAYSAPAISYAAPAVARVEHLAPSYSVHKSEVYTSPLAKTTHISPAVHSIAAAPLIAAPAAPLLRSGYLGHSYGYAAAPATFGFARALPLAYARYGAGW